MHILLYCISVWCLRICLAFAVCCFTSAFCPWGQLVHQKVLSSRGRHRCTDFGHIFKFSWGPFFIEGLYVGNMNQAFFFHLNFFSRFARQKTKIFQKNWILGFFHIYFKARIVRAGLNVALIILFQYMKRNPSIKIYFSTFCQKTKFSDAN